MIKGTITTTITTTNIERENLNLQQAQQVIEGIQRVQNLDNALICTTDELEEAQQVRNLNPIQRLNWLRERRNDHFNHQRAAGGADNIDTLPTVQINIATDIVIVEVPRIEVPIDANNYGNILGTVLEQALPILVEAENPLGDRMAADFRQAMNRAALPANYRLFEHFLNGLNINREALENIQILPHRIHTLEGLPLWIFRLFSIFSSGTIAYLILHISSESSHNAILFLKMLFQTYRCLLLTGIPIRALLFTPLNSLRASFLRGLRAIAVWLRHNIAVETLPNTINGARERIVNVMVLTQAQLTAFTNDARNTFRGRVIEINANAIANIEDTALNIANRQAIDLEAVANAAIAQGNAMNAAIRVNNQALIATRNEPWWYRVFGFVPPYIRNFLFALVTNWRTPLFMFTTGSLLVYFRGTVFRLGQHGRGVIRDIFLGNNTPTIPGNDTLPVEGTIQFYQRAVNFILSRIDVSRINLEDIVEVLFHLGGFS